MTNNHSFVDRDMFVRYLGGGIDHGGSATDIETPASSDDEPNGGSDEHPGEGPDHQPAEGFKEEGEEGEEDKDEDALDGERVCVSIILLSARRPGESRTSFYHIGKGKE